MITNERKGFAGVSKVRGKEIPMCSPSDAGSIPATSTCLNEK